MFWTLQWCHYVILTVNLQEVCCYCPYFRKVRGAGKSWSQGYMATKWQVKASENPTELPEPPRLIISSKETEACCSKVSGPLLPVPVDPFPLFPDIHFRASCEHWCSLIPMPASLYPLHSRTSTAQSRVQPPCSTHRHDLTHSKAASGVELLLCLLHADPCIELQPSRWRRW